MKGAKRKDFSVYEFKEEDEAAEPAAGRFLGRLRARTDPKFDDPVTKSSFLRAFSSDSDYKKTDVSDLLCIDLHTRDCGGSYVLGATETNFASVANGSKLNEVVLCSTPCDDQSCHAESEPGRSVRDSLAATPVAVYSDDDESCTSGSRSPSTTTSDLSEKDGCWESPVSDNCCSAARENFDREINICPEYVVCGDVFYTEAQITFGSDCFVFEYSNTCEDEGNFILEWELSDLLCIESHWSTIVGAVHMEIHLRANAITGVENVDEASSIMKMTFPLHDSNWSEKELKIISLAPRYKDIWNILPDCELAAPEEDGECNMICSRDYFTEILEPFNDVIYPKGDPDAISISKRDVELLQPDTFINDTIIDFYIKYLKNKLHPDDRNRFHFFNSFFFRKLADLDKDPGSALEGREAFKRVRKWTRKVNIFEKDYIFIPVNFSLHWSLLVICHPGEVASLKDDDRKELCKVPCILHMDSLKGSHNGLRNLVKSYLWEEWKERHPECSEEHSSKFSNLRFVSLELPQQENLFDCGLFLLHYVELFLEEAPINFSPFKITEFSIFLSMKWFEPSEASRKRSFIRKLIYDLSDDPSQKVVPTTCSNKHLSLKCPESDIKKRSIVEFLSEPCGSTMASNCDMPTPISDRVNEKLLAGSFLGAVQFDKAKVENLREFIKLETTLSSSPDRQDHFFQKDAFCQTLKVGELINKEHADEDIQFLSMNRERDTLLPSPKDLVRKASSSTMQEVTDIAGDSAPTSRKTDSIVSIQEEAENIDYVSDSPTSASDENLEPCDDRDASEVGHTKGETEDSVDSLGTDVKVVCGDGIRQVTLLQLSSQEVEATGTRNSLDKDKIELTGDDSVTGTDKQPLKRQKAMHPEGGRRQSRRFAKDT